MWYTRSNMSLVTVLRSPSTSECTSLGTESVNCSFCTHLRRCWQSCIFCHDHVLWSWGFLHNSALCRPFIWLIYFRTLTKIRKIVRWIDLERKLFYLVFLTVNHNTSSSYWSVRDIQLYLVSLIVRLLWGNCFLCRLLSVFRPVFLWLHAKHRGNLV